MYNLLESSAPWSASRTESPGGVLEHHVKTTSKWGAQEKNTTNFYRVTCSCSSIPRTK